MKSFKFLFFLVGVGLAFSPFNALAKTQTDEDIFSVEKVQQWQREALDEIDKKEVLPDKNVNPNDKGVYGGWTWRDGVICITDSKSSGIITTGHAGMIAVAPHYYATIESNPENGVHLYFQSWDTKYPNNQSWQVGVSSTTEHQDHVAAQWAVNQRGKSYNYNFLNKETTDSFYCSQLVWAAYKNTAGVDLDTSSWGNAIHPFELLQTPKTTLIYKTWTP